MVGIKSLYPTKCEAKKIARDLVEKKLAVAGYVKDVDAIYAWDDDITVDDEYKLELYTIKKNKEEVEWYIRSMHPFKNLLI